MDIPFATPDTHDRDMVTETTDTYRGTFPYSWLLGEAGQRPFPELLRRRFPAGRQTPWVTCYRLLHPFHQFGRINPTLSQFDEPSRGFSDCWRASSKGLFVGLRALLQTG